MDFGGEPKLSPVGPEIFSGVVRTTANRREIPVVLEFLLQI